MRHKKCVSADKFNCKHFVSCYIKNSRSASSWRPETNITGYIFPSKEWTLTVWGSFWLITWEQRKQIMYDIYLCSHDKWGLFLLYQLLLQPNPCQKSSKFEGKPCHVPVCIAHFIVHLCRQVGVFQVASLQPASNQKHIARGGIFGAAPQTSLHPISHMWVPETSINHSPTFCGIHQMVARCPLMVSNHVNGA